MPSWKGVYNYQNSGNFVNEMANVRQSLNMERFKHLSLIIKYIKCGLGPFTIQYIQLTARCHE